MKYLLMVSCLFLSVIASADQTIVCVDREIRDSSYAAEFNLKQSVPTVELFILSGALDGECQYDEGAIDLSLTCNVMTSTDSGYEVKLFSTGGSSLKATISSWNMAGKDEPISLPCEM